jgi:hypothetical protein
MDPRNRRVAVEVDGRRVTGVVLGHRSEDPKVDASDERDEWFVEYDADNEPDPGTGGFYKLSDMEFLDE